MNIHEYQGKQIFRAAGVPVPEGYPAFTVDEAVEIAEKIGSLPVMVKAQIHAGGRGKGGGVKIARTIDEVREHAQNILGMNLITHQTGPGGKLVQRLLVESASNIASEFYAGIVLDRSLCKFCFMVSTEGGVEIEKVANNNPDKIILIGSITAIFGIILTGIGIFSAVIIAPDISKIAPYILWNGFKISLVTTFTGGVTLLFSTIMWYIFTNRYKSQIL